MSPCNLPPPPPICASLLSIFPVYHGNNLASLLSPSATPDFISTPHHMAVSDLKYILLMIVVVPSELRLLKYVIAYSTCLLLNQKVCENEWKCYIFYEVFLH